MSIRNLNASQKTKHTPVGEIPVEWEVRKLRDVGMVQTGISKSSTRKLVDPVELPYLRVANVQDGHIDLTVVKLISVSKQNIERFSLKKGDVLLTEGGDFDKLGRGHVWNGAIEPCLHQNHIFAVRVNQIRLLPYFLASFTAGPAGRRYFLSCSKQTTNLASINSTQLKSLRIPLPPLSEQRKIAEILSAWDRAIDQAEKLIDAKQRRKKALQQQLLTGKLRFPQFGGPETPMQEAHFGSFPSDWAYVPIRQFANEARERHDGRTEIPVLSCTKYDGLVDSLTYFGKRVFSKDTSGYKVVRKGNLAYATNHIEEGSIGLLEDIKAGLVSPMYTVFTTDSSRIFSPFLFALFKTELFRHIFEVNTNASVNRRGSLRWNQFRQIHVALPTMEEQKAIHCVLRACDAEIATLQKERDALKEQKKGLMQKLLTGQVRVKV